MKFHVTCLALLVLGLATPFQSTQGQTKSANGSICVAAPEPPNTGEKGLGNPAGGNRISTYTIQINKLPATVASNAKAVRLGPFSTGRKHLVKIFGDGKLMHSFWFSFGKFRTNELCLWFNSLYETWQLWGVKGAGAKCKCE